MARLVIRLESLQPCFHFVERRRDRAIREVRVAQQLFQLRLVDRQRLGAAFRQRRIAFVDVIRDVREEQGSSKRRGLVGFERGDADFAPLNFAEISADRRQIENVTDTFAVSLKQNRKRRNRDATASKSAARLRCCHKWRAHARRGVLATAEHAPPPHEISRQTAR